MIDERDPSAARAGTEAWHGFVDDASVIPDRASTTRYDHPLVGARTASDSDLPTIASFRGPVRLRLEGGAAQLERPLRYAAQAGVRVVALETALRDPADPAGNARRVVAAVESARAAGVLGDEVVVHVRVDGEPGHAALAALDELAAAELALTLPVDAADTTFAAWADAALDRELPFTLAEPRGRAAGTDDVAGALAAVRTTARLWDGADAPLAAGLRWCRAWPAHYPETAVATLLDLLAQEET